MSTLNTAAYRATGCIPPIAMLWVRPSDWLAMPTVSPAEDKIVILTAIFPGVSYVNLRITMSSGQYHIDWGDGTAENINSAAQQCHAYDYANSVFDGTLTSRGYKQAIITITPTIGTNHFVTPEIFLKYAIQPTGFAIPWLDVVVSGPSITGLNNVSATGSPKYMERFRILSGASSGVDLGYLFGFTVLARSLQTVEIWCKYSSITSGFDGCSNLTDVYMPGELACASLASLFGNCVSLRNTPVLDTRNVTDFSSMFSGCKSLETVTPLNTSSGQTFSSMFNGCSKLLKIPFLDTHAGTAMNFMFSGSGLREVPLLNTGANLNFTSMFNGCTALKEIPLLDTHAGTDFTSMFNGGSALITIPLLDTSAGQTFTSMFQSCTALKTIPLINTSAGTAFGNMFNACSSLQACPALATAGTTFTSMFTGCGALNSIGALNLSSGTAMGTMLNNCTGLASAPFSGTKTTISYSNCNLSRTALLAVFAGLGKASAQTITITGNWGSTMLENLTDDTAVSKTNCGTTSGSTVVSQSNTSSLVVGYLVTGTGINTAVAVTLQDAGDTVTRTGHGLANGTPVSFATIVTTTGIVTYTTYYVVNATSNTFQVSATVGGSALPLTTDGSGTLLYGSFITAINPNVSFTLDKPASATGTVTLSARGLNTSIAALKGWTVTG